MFNLSFVRMARAFKIHLHPITLSSKFVKNIFETVKIFLFVVNKSISYFIVQSLQHGGVDD